MFQVWLPCYLGLRLVSFNKLQQNEEAFFFQKHSWRVHVSPMFPSFPYGKHCFQCQFLFSRCKLCLHYMAENFNEIQACEHLHKFCKPASKHSCNFFEQFGQRPNFASTFKLDGTIQCPFFYSNCCTKFSVIKV